MYLSERATKRARQMLLKKAIILLSAFVIIVTMISFLVRLPSAAAEISIIGNTVTETEALEKSLEEIIGHDFLFVFKRDNILFFPIGKIKKELLTDFPRLKEIKIRPKRLNQIEISVYEREGDYLWCRNEKECFLIDDSGFIYAPAPYLSGNAFLRFFGGDDLKVGDVFLVKSEFDRILAFKDRLDSIGLKTSRVFLDEEGNYEFFLTEHEGKIIIYKENNFEKSFDNLTSAMTVSPLDKKLKDEIASLEYLDLRFENRVVYKFQ